MMYEQAYEVFDYLPREAGGLARYINHLWGAFEALMEKDDPVSAFAILPFHLLFMLSVQGKVYRISAFDVKSYQTTLASCDRINAGNRKVLQDNPPIPDIQGIIPSGCSVRNLSLLHEKQLFGFLRLIGADDATIDKAIELIEIRGTYAHANGNIEENFEERIDMYLNVLRSIQIGMTKLNDAIANQWISELTEEEDMNEFVDNRLLSTLLAPIDFRTGTLSVFSLQDDTRLEDWKAGIVTALAINPTKTPTWLKHIAEKHEEKVRRDYLYGILN